MIRKSSSTASRRTASLQSRRPAFRAAFEPVESRRLMAAFGGVEFPQGASSFADRVLSFSPTQASTLNQPSSTLGAPQGREASDDGLTSSNAVSLGRAGSLTLGFTDNTLTNSGTSAADLWVFEIGAIREGTNVLVRPTADTRPLLNAFGATATADGFFPAGQLARGGTGGLDVDAAFPGFGAGRLRFDAVRVTDNGTNTYNNTVPGADIDAIGAISSAPAVVPSGDFALDFDGVNDVAYVNDSASLDEIERNQRLTVEAIVRVDRYDQGWFTIVDKTDSSGFGWTLQIRQNEGIELTSVATGTMRVRWTPVLGQTYHVAATYDRSLATFYVNGQAIGTVAQSAALPNTNGPLALGRNPSGALEHADGTIDELRLWSRVRTASEIRANQLTRLNGTEANLVGYWRFNEGAGAAAADSARGNTMRLGFGSEAPRWVASTRPVLTGAIAGRAFSDTNGNGRLDAGEVGFSNRTIFADLDNDGVLDSNEPRTATNVSGNYVLANLSPRTYPVRMAAVAGQVITAPRHGVAATATVFAGTTTQNVNFGSTAIGSDTDDTIAEASSLTRNTRVWGALESNDDVDMWRISLSRGETVTFVLRSASFDAYLRLFDANGNQVALDDDSAGGLDARLTFTAPAAGTYYLAISSYYNRSANPLNGAGKTDSGEAGSWTLDVI